MNTQEFFSKEECWKNAKHIDKFYYTVAWCSEK